MEPTTPFWFKQRQANLEPAGEEMYQVKAPNMEAAFVLVRAAPAGGWQAAVRRHAEGPDLEVTVRAYASPGEAWPAAFELLRRHCVV